MATARCTWTEVSGVDGYNVYLKSNGTFVKQNSELITETVYDIENLEDGNYEAYATSVLNSVESDASNVKGFEVASISGYPVIESIEVSEGNVFEHTYVVDKPLGTQEGDLLVASIGARIGNNSINNTRYDSGWVEVGMQQTGASAGDTYQSVAYKVATGDEPSSYSFTTRQNFSSRAVSATAGILRISGADTSNPVVASESNNASSTNDISNSGVVATDDNLLIFCACSSNANDEASDINTPAGMTPVWMLKNDGSGSVRSGHRMASKEVDSGATGSITATHNGTKTTSFVIAIKPAAS